MKIEGLNVISVGRCCPYCHDWLVRALRQVNLCEHEGVAQALYAPVHRARTWRDAMDWALSEGQEEASMMVRGYYGV